MEERRKFVRVKELKTVEARVKNSNGEMVIVEIKDMSLIGMNFYSETEIEKDKIIQMQISLPDGLPYIELESKVLWQLSSLDDRFATGVRFCNEDDKAKERLTSFIKKQGKSVRESREFIRCIINTEIVITDLNNPGVSFAGKTVDISHGGMKLISNTKLETGTCLQLTLVLPGNQEAVEFKGRVAWVRKETDKNGFSVGIIYNGLDVAVRKKIFKYIEQCSKKK